MERKRTRCEGDARLMKLVIELPDDTMAVYETLFWHRCFALRSNDGVLF